MIIAILEDKKGFKNSFNMPKFRNKIQIPLRPDKMVEPYLITGSPPPFMKKVEFHFVRWIEKDKIAFYRED